MCPGRVILGIGTGEGLNEVPSTGAPWPEFKERFARLREAVTLIRKLWREERVTFEGEYYKTEKATIYDRPDRGDPDLCRRRGRRGGALCRPHRRRLHLHQRQEVGALHPDADAERRRGHRQGRRAEEAAVRQDDRDQGLVRHRQGSARSRIRATGRRWRSRPRRRCRSRIRSRCSGSPTRCRSSAPPAAGSCPTDPDEVVEKVGGYVGLGFKHLVFHAPGPDQARFLKLFAEQVAPRMRKKFG